MANRDIEELKNKPEQDIQKDIGVYRDRLWELKRDLAAGKVKNVKEIKKTKKLVARALTIITWKTKKGV